MFRLICGGDWSISDMGIVAGLFYVRKDNVFFPYDQWNDMPFAILEMWCSALLKDYKDTEHFDLYFLDGSYKLIVDKQYGNELLYFHIQMVKDFASDNACVVDCFTIPAVNFFDELEKAIETCYTYAQEHALPSKKLLKFHKQIGRISLSCKKNE